MKYILFSMICMVSTTIYAQGIDPNTPCAYNFQKIICRYDNNGNRIFRGFELVCPPENRLSSNSPTPKKEIDSMTEEFVEAHISPNPTTENVTVSFSKQLPINTVLYLYDLQGRLLLEQYVNTQSMQISLSSYSSGMYMITVINKGKIYYNGKISKLD